jgi:gliding motility-associated-like protein
MDINLSSQKPFLFNSGGISLLFLVAFLFCFCNRFSAFADPVKIVTDKVSLFEKISATIPDTTKTVSGSISSYLGSASTSPDIQQFTVSGSSLTASIIATAPANFQVSLSPGSGYGSSVTVAATAGVVSNTVVYVRSSATAPLGSITGSISLTSAGAVSLNVPVNGTISALPTVNPAPSSSAYLSQLGLSSGTLTPVFAEKTTSYAASVTNATLSITVTVTPAAGATVKVNGTAVAQGAASGAIALVVGSNTIAIVVTAQDGVTTGTYKITVTRAVAGANSNIYGPIGVETLPGSSQLADDGITIHPGISPNGDGINDFLQIDNINQFPDNRLAIMNRNGILVYETTGYNNTSKVFDGHSSKNGAMQLPGTYFYELDYTVNGIIRHKTGFLVLKY